MIIFCSILLWGNITTHEFRIEWFVYAQTAAYSITFLTALFVVIKKAAFRELGWYWVFLLMMLKRSASFALLVLLMAQYNRIDSVIIERLLPDETGKQQAGIYAQAYRLLDAAHMIAFLFSVLLLPIFSRMIKMKANVEKIVKMAFSLLYTISLTVAICSLFYSVEIMKLLYPIHELETMEMYMARLEQSAFIFSLLMFGFVAISTIYVFGTLLTANGNLKQLNIIAGSGVLISFGLNMLLVPKLQATGSAYASLSAQGITAIAQMITAVILFRFPLNMRYVGKLVFFTAGLVISGYITSSVLEFNWLINLGILLFMAAILSFGLRLLNVKEVIRIIKSEKA
jgi:O-antigen/teichoic acid export membrane protein